jgi:hypothetical protein
MYPSAVRITPDPTPDDGICAKPRDEKPSEVMVTTESRTAATTSVSSGAGAALALDAAAATAAASVGADDGADRSGPATSAAVPPAASIAESRTTAAMPTIPPARTRRACLGVSRDGSGGTTAVRDVSDAANGAETVDPCGVSGLAGPTGVLVAAGSGIDWYGA